MSGREFDKAIQEKAQQLRLDPSPEVWEKVSANLHRRRKRRVAAWIFSAAAILSGIMVVGYRELANNRTGNIGRPELSERSTTITATDKHKISSTPTVTKTKTAIDKKSTQQGKIAVHSLTVPDPAVAYPQQKSSHNKKAKQFYATVGSPDLTDDPTLFISNEDPGTKREMAPAEIALAKNALTSPTVPANKKALSDRLNAMQKKITENTGKESPLWSGDIFVAAGISPMISLQNSAEALSGSASLSLINNPTTSVSLPGQASAVRPAGAYQLGITISRKINQRLTAISGIRYAYFANQISVGETVNTAVPVYNDRMERLNATAIYTGNGKRADYTNQYHFLQLPLEIGIGLDKKQRFNLEGGFVLGYLVHSNALLYNHVSGVYYSDNDAIRKWQAGVSTRFNYRILNGRQFNMDLGPFIQYQLSPLYVAPKGQHLLAAGLSGRILLKK